MLTRIAQLGNPNFFLKIIMAEMWLIKISFEKPIIFNFLVFNYNAGEKAMRS